MKFIILAFLALAGLTGCQTPNWTHNPNAWRMMAEFSRQDQAPFTGAAPMRPVQPTPPAQ